MPPITKPMAVVVPLDETRARGELGPLLRLALPLILVQLGQQLLGFTHIAFAGRVDELALAATGLGGTLFFAGAILGIGLVMGLDPIAAQAIGAGRPRLARHAMWQGIYVALAIALPISGLVLLVAGNLERFGVAPTLAAATRLYVHGRLPSMAGVFLIIALRAYMQATHVTRPIIYSIVVANLLNAAAAWLFLFGDEGLAELGLPRIGMPAFGVRGVAWAANFATAAQFLVLCLATRRIEPGEGDEPLRSIDRKVLGRIFGIGLPLGFQLLAEVGIFSLVGLLMGRIGAREMAAHQVALQLASFTFMVPLGIGQATSVRVGRAIGRGDTRAARRAGLTGIACGAAFMTCSALAMWLFPAGLARIVTSQAAVIPAAVVLLRIAGAFQIFDGIQAVASGALRGAGVTRFALVANIAAYWFVGLPIAAACAYGLGLGPLGLWIGLTGGLAVAAAALLAKFVRLSRRPIAAIPG